MKILLIEDDQKTAEFILRALHDAGYETEHAADGVSGLDCAMQKDFDCAVVDIMLPKMDGFEICRRVRERLDTPIIMLTAREEENDKIMGLDLGADDYMTKPFSLGELFSRIKANVRRYSRETVPEKTIGNSPDVSESTIITIEDLEIDTGKYSVKKAGEEISLSKQQYELLVFLANNRGKKYRQEALLEQVWGYDEYYGDERTVDVTVARLRKRIEDNPSQPKYIKNKRGMGYFIE